MEELCRLLAAGNGEYGTGIKAAEVFHCQLRDPFGDCTKLIGRNLKRSHDARFYTAAGVHSAVCACALRGRTESGKERLARSSFRLRLLARHQLLNLHADEGIVQLWERVPLGRLGEIFLRLGGIALSLISLAQAIQVTRVLLIGLL